MSGNLINELNNQLNNPNTIRNLNLDIKPISLNTNLTKGKTTPRTTPRTTPTPIPTLAPGEKIRADKSIRMDNKKSFDDIVAERENNQNDTSDETLQTDYDRKIIQNERNRLRKLSNMANIEIEENIKTSLVQNLSLKVIITNTINTLVDILQELSKGDRLEDIFLKGDRMFYLGLLTVFVSFCLYLINITS